jgi:hypothetical protein
VRAGKEEELRKALKKGEIEPDQVVMTSKTPTGWAVVPNVTQRDAMNTKKGGSLLSGRAHALLKELKAT